MLIGFKVKNYKSFKDEVTLSMVATSSKELEEKNVIDSKENNIRLLKSCVVYGANASGKTNLIDAIAYMRNIVADSLNNQYYNPFKLSDDTINEPSFFEIYFIIEGVKYRYGFEIDKEKVHSEWLYYTPKNRESLLFYRNNDNFKLNKNFKEGLKLKDKTRKDVLFISVVANFNGEISGKIINWFHRLQFLCDSKSFIHKIPDEYKYILERMLNIADVGIDGIEYSESDNKIYTLHKKYDKDKNFVSLERIDIDNESVGVKKLINIFSSILFTLTIGGVLVVDELDSSLHPLMLAEIVELFNSYSNQKAHIIFNCQDIFLLMTKILRKDQIWFTEKNQYGESSLYSLAEFKEGKGDQYFKDYLLGKYGAIPSLGDFTEII